MTEKEKKGPGIEPKKGNNHEQELVATLGETPLTVEQEVVQLRSEVQNINKGVFELLGLFKEILKTQVNTEVTIEKNITNLIELNKRNALDATKTSQKVEENMSKMNETLKKTLADIQKKLENMDIDIDYMASEHSGAKYAGYRPRRK